MNFSRAKLYKAALLALIVVLFTFVSLMQNALNRDRRELGFMRGTMLENAPPVLQFTTVALGSFRGLIANVLWIRASQLQEDEKFFEMVQLADWITKLEPHFVQVWCNQAWNMAYNISVKFKEPQDRWRWLQRGIELLREDGLRYNPDETLIYRELSWLFQHKMGQNLDDAHQFYKLEWAREMQTLFGGKPNFTELLNPQTPEAKERAKKLREHYKMDPQIMKEVNELYGPLEWRLPDAHAIYWAELGRRKAKPKDQDTLRRSIYQTMQQSFIRGALVMNKRITNSFVLGPNLDAIANVSKTYEMMMAEDESMRDHIKIPHKNFLKVAVYLLYADNRKAEAERWFKYLKEKYPGFMGNDVAASAKLSLDDYAVQCVFEEIGDTDVNKTTDIIMGFLRTAYMDYALDDDERGATFHYLARSVWNSYQKRVAGIEGRVGLKPLSDLQKTVADHLLDSETGLEPQYAARLRIKLGRTEETNAPPAKISPGK